MRKKISLDEFKNLFYVRELTLDEISSYFGVTISAIGSFRHRNNLPPRGWKNGVPPMTGKKMPEWLKIKLGSINKERWTGDKNPRWSGGRRVNSQGYVIVRKPDHQFRDRGGYVREHRLVMEEYLGRFLEPNEQVHHLNGNKKDNRIDNLFLCQSNSEHRKIFHIGDSLKHLRKTPSHIKHSIDKTDL